MKRRQFVQAAGLLTAPFSPLSLPLQPTGLKIGTACLQPPFLKSGSVIGITAPSGAVTAEEIEPALQVLRSWGYQVLVGNTIGKKDGSFGGTDTERAADLQQMLDHPEVAAIWCARGGYGLVRIIDRLNWKKFRQRPKWIVGFSDATILHSQLQRVGVASIHAKMLTSFPTNWDSAPPLQVNSILSTRRLLEGHKPVYTVPPHPQQRAGVAEGVLAGGNLKLLETQAGTASDLDTRSKILFVEDVGEYLYSIDRMFCNLLRTGKLYHLAGLVVGGFRIKPDDDGVPFGRTLPDIVLEKVGTFGYPVCFDFEVGHQMANWAMKCGAMHRLTVSGSGCTLVEI